MGRSFGAHLSRKAELWTPAQAARLTGHPTSHLPTADAPNAGTVVHGGQPRRESDDDDKSRFRASDLAASPGEAVDPLDPMTRALFAPGLRSSAVAITPAPAPDEGVSRSSRVSLEHVLSRLVRRIAWSGDAHTGSARLELGAGALEGATLTIHSDDGKVRVSLELPPGVDQAEWKERIARRLGARGLQVTALEVE